MRLRLVIPFFLLSLCLLVSPALSDYSVTLAWDPSPDPDVQGTIVHYGFSSRTYTKHKFIGPETRTTINNLIFGATYYFAVTVTNSLGLESEYSNEVSTNNVPKDTIVYVGARLEYGTNLSSLSSTSVLTAIFTNPQPNQVYRSYLIITNQAF